MIRRMNNCRLAPLLMALVLAGAAAAEDAADGWQPGGTTQGKGFAYQIFSMQREGEAFVHFKVSGTIDAAPEALQRAFCEMVTNPARAPSGETRTLIAKDDGGFIVHSYMDLPPLFSDRDIILRGESSADPATGARRVEWIAVEHPKAPRVDGAIRIEDAGGAWLFAPDGANRSKVTYENHIDLRGSLPGWLTERLLASTVGKSFEDIAADTVGKSAAR